MVFESFCGHPLWDPDVSWNSPQPVFSPCLTETGALWVSSGFLCLLAPFAIYFASKEPKHSLPFTTRLYIRLGFSLILCGVTIYELINVILEIKNGHLIYQYQYVAPIIRLISFLIATFLVHFYRRKGVHTSGLLFIYWFLMGITTAFNYWTLIDGKQNPELRIWTFNKKDMVVKTLQLCCVWILLFLNCFADTRKKSTNIKHSTEYECPYESTSFLGRLTFIWYDSMALLGFRKTLTQADMWHLPEEDRTQLIQDKFSRLMTASTKYLALPDKNKSTQVNGRSDKTGKPAKKPKTIKISLLSTLIIGFWPWMVACAFFKLISSILVFANPQLMDALLTFIASDAPVWQGAILALGMFIATLIQSMFDSQYEFWIQTTSMRVKSALIACVYQKSLRLSSSGRHAFTTGEIINLMAVDIQRIVEYINIVNIMWSSPVQLIVTVILLWRQLGVASIAGLSIMIALIPFNGFITSRLQALQKKVMKEKDKRSKMMSEILNGMKVLKLYAWEGAFGDTVTAIRAREIKFLKRQAVWSTGVAFAFAVAPFLVTLVSFMTYVFIDPNNILDANKAFVSISLINILRMPLAFLPMVVTFGANFIISVRRINKYLQGDELDPNTVNHEPNYETPVVVKKATFCWSYDEQPVLKNIDISVKRNKLVAIVGTIGSGKSSLLSALLGDLYKQEGYINVYGRVAFVPQSAWIQNATVRDNILFGEPYSSTKYSSVIDACALTTDLQILTGGDQTEIGERGINVSGGQKQRISIARAVYSNSDIYLLDDPLSAVDAHVASHLFDKVIGPKGVLRHKTRILVTHRITFLPQVDEIIVMKDGKVHESGTYTELMNKKGEFSDFIIQYLAEAGDEDLHGEDPVVVEQMKEVIGHEEVAKRRSTLHRMDTTLSIGEMSKRNRTQSSIRKRGQQSSDSKDLSNYEGDLTGDIIGEVKANQDSAAFKLVETEGTETGSVKLSVYLDYFGAIGYWAVFGAITFLASSSAFNFGTNSWLTAWTDDSLIPGNVNNTALRNKRLGVYAALGLCESSLILGNSVIANLAVLTGSAWIHNQMLYRIIRAPMAFFDTTPLGRILNRFTKDIDTADSTIGFNLRFFLSQFFRAVVAIVGICTESGYLVIVIIVLGIAYITIQKFYIASSRQLRRIESITRSPIYTHFSETVTGATSIRAYGVSDRFIQECYRRTDVNNSSFFPNLGASRWLAVRLELLGNLAVTIAAVFAVASRNKLSPGSTGLAISYSLQITTILNMLVRSISDIETNIVSIERCMEYTRIGIEAEWVNPDHRPKPEWPNKGEIIFKDYSTRYRPGLDLVLKKIGFRINPNEKVGIVGRTGAGKSSLTLALFRLIEPANGVITIDGQDITQFGLHDLRSRLTVIPQDPVLFSSSFRSNFDPFNKYSDTEIWKALEQANLKEFVNTLEEGLDYEIAEGGENLSVGQRQLVCLTRALLRKTKVLVLDEATAAVDVETDELIQNTIRREFSDCTIVTIAHRLNTILDYDKIMVMDRGNIIEYDSPTNLLANTRSEFYSMAKDAKLV